MKPVLFCLLGAPVLAQALFPSLNTSPWLGQEMLGAVEDRSVTINVAFDQDMQVYFEYGTSSGVYPNRTSPQIAYASAPLNTVLADLQPNTQYFYRVQYGPAGGSTFTARKERTFVTQRPRGAGFTFLVQADPHLDTNSSSDVYKLTLANELAEHADFLIDLGDTMMSDKLDGAGNPVGGGTPTAAGVLARTQLLRSYYDQATHSLPLFLALGNHEGEWGADLTGTPNFATWNFQDRTAYFPNPAPDAFFTGDKQLYDLNGNLCTVAPSVTCGLGQRRSYYSWNWGDALFVVLDPFWNQTQDAASTQAGNGQTCCQKGAGYWSLTLGDVQYNWLKQTLESSTAMYKFIFLHNLVGGVDPVVNGTAQGPMRGGVESAKFLEWGGYNLDGSWGFGTYRPGWPMPIHQLLVANHVTAVFHGHDHLYARQSLDGIAYQEVPQPSASNTNLGTRASDYGYTQGTMLGGRGYLRLQVSPSGTTVQYIETWLPSEQKGSIVNRMVADSYNLAATTGVPTPTISSVTNAEGDAAIIAPNTWLAIKGSNLAPAGNSRTWQASDFTNNQMPTQLDGVSVTVNGKPAYIYYISSAQLNVLSPPDAISGSASIVASVNGAPSAAFSVQAQSLSPSLFVFNGGPYIAARHLDGSIVGPSTLFPGASTPAKPGETILLYGNGFGPTSSAIANGSGTQSGTLSPLPVITIGGLQAAVQFAGLVGPGEFQFNVVVPSSIPNGDQSISVSYSGLTTQPGTLVTIQGTSSGGSTGSFALTSPAASDGGTLPAAYTCDGTGSTLPLAWQNPPVGTAEFALLMTTLPGDGTTKWNWVLYHIPATTTSLAKDTFLIGTPGIGSDGPGAVYNPPCSQGPGAKVYSYTLYALSAAPAFSVPASQVTGQMVTDAIASIILASAKLSVSYTRTTSTGSSANCLYIRNSVTASKSGTASVSCDGTYAYVSSTGITTAPMMNGITSTNLQVPTPQNFQGANGWKIPVNPALATSPTSVVDGPIGVAINGVPIFNPCTQGGCVTGGDTKALGQLDRCNGHSGRADDYHYHAAPTCLMADQPANYWDTHPLGWALDGFAIFGYHDADGSVAARDSLCGGNTKAVPNAPSGYSYHVTDSPPYVNNCLAGTPSPDLPNQASKYRPLRQPPVTPFNVSGMTLTTAADGYQELQFTSATQFTTTETGSDSYANRPGTYKIRYKELTGAALLNLLAQKQNANATACWNFQFVDSSGSTTQPSVSYCK